MSATPSPAARLRALLAEPGILLMPCCYDALSARLIEEAGFPLSFMSGFSVSAARLGMPDTGLISYGEMVDQGRSICAAVQIPVIGDGDTGYGNAVNVKRTVEGYRQAGFAGIMIEDQVSPKRCGHTLGKEVVARRDALTRLRAAVDARDEGADIVIVARTDARATHGFQEALYRAEAFADAGADVIFLEAPVDRDEMKEFCHRVAKPTLANMLEGGRTPWVPPNELEELGYKIAAYPVTLLSAAVAAMRRVLDEVQRGMPATGLLSFAELRDVVGFDAYDAVARRYRGESEVPSTPRPPPHSG
ncbi:MAG TPA: isocitrate lyase/PEP mutase family protein [Polyangiaceae bacterium]|nr:isocitrate lyase/PEP mutase family protein [Polyangiaceae bacterium]